MTNIPNADAPIAEITKYGIDKAAALEALRCVLHDRQLGWISALTECKMQILNGQQVCFIRVLTSRDLRCNAQVRINREGPKDRKDWSAEVIFDMKDVYDRAQVAVCDITSMEVRCRTK